jgi:uncharacterized phage-associated protein
MFIRYTFVNKFAHADITECKISKLIYFSEFYLFVTENKFAGL